MKFCSFCLFSGERLAALAVEDMDNVVTEGEVDGLAVTVAELVVFGQVDGGDDEDDVLAAGVDVQVDGGAHHLGDVHGGADEVGHAAVAEHDVLGAHAEYDGAGLGAVGAQARLLLLGDGELGAVEVDGVLVAGLFELGTPQMNFFDGILRQM